MTSQHVNIDTSGVFQLKRDDGTTLFSVDQSGNVAALGTGLGGSGGGSLRGTLGWYDAKADGGCVMNGTTDDLDNFQALLNTVGAAGGGVVYIPPGTMLWNHDLTGQGACYVRYDNVHIIGAGVDQTIIKTGSGAATNIAFVVQGQYKPTIIASNNNMPENRTTVYNLKAGTIFAKGTTTVTLDTVGDAANFANGDLIYIKTGNTIGSTAQGNPKAEMNEVVAADATTGVISLRTPTVRAYQQEYWVSGTTGRTEAASFTPAPAGSAAPFCVVKCNDICIRNFSARDFTLDHSLANPNTGNIMHLQTIYGLRLARIKTIGRSNLFGANNIRHFTMDDLQHWSMATTTSNLSCVLSTGRGTCDGLVSNIRAYAQNNSAAIVMSEGTASVVVNGFLLKSSTLGTTAGQSPISIQTYSQDNILRGGVIINNGGVAGTPAVAEDALCLGGNYVDGVIIDGGNHVKAISYQSSGFHLGDTLVRTGTIAAGGTGITPPLEPRGEVSISGRLNTVLGMTSVTIGVVPVNYMVTGVFVDVTVAFDGTGTNDIIVGYSGATTAYVTGTGASFGTTGSKTAVTGTQYGRDQQTARTVVVSYQGTGATTGKAVVMLKLSPIQAPT